jgi:hypothetical protein
VTREQALLLRAALLRGPEALDAWRAWHEATRIDALEPDSQWLLPLLFLNLRAQGVPAARLVRYQNVWLHNWYKDNLALRAIERSASGRRGDGRPLVVVGGAALALAYYDTLGARPFVSVDLADPADLGEAVLARTLAGGWKSIRWRVLGPADQVVRICARREDWDPRSRLFWVADLVTVWRRHPRLDLVQATQRAERTGDATAVSHALQTIEDVLSLRLAATPRATAGVAAGSRA